MGRSILLLGSSVLLVLSAAAPASAGPEAAESGEVVWLGDDIRVSVLNPPEGLAAVGTQGVFDDDPLGLVAKAPFVQRHSLDTDHFEVWLCGDTGFTMSQAIAALESATVDYFDAISNGRYQIAFSPGGTSAESDCRSSITPVGNPEGLWIVDDVTGGGYASPGWICGGDSSCDYLPDTYPGNDRYSVIGADSLNEFPSITAHELGHTLHWPHSSSDEGVYDNWIDLMSGNATTGGWTEPEPYGTLAYNRYQAGWIDPGDVLVADSGHFEAVVQPFDASGIQMIVIPTTEQTVFYTLGARTTSTYDPIPTEWQGVEVYVIDHSDCGYFDPTEVCTGVLRGQYQQPSSPRGFEHVLQVGESMNIDGVVIEVTARTGTGYTVTVDNPNDPVDPPDPGGELPFSDIASSTFVADIVWLADQGITAGCNPPSNTRFCPSDTVTRQQMAAFLVRALGLTDNGGGNSFVDDDGSVFENDIAKLAAAGITLGCNPPANTRFCPTAPVTREQMAAFLARAYGLTDNGGGNSFVDDDGSVFENDIAKLAAAGITLGCNPPANTRFCPTAPVTREQMAAFLRRAATR